MSAPDLSPGWYPDPSGAPIMRWWDGRQWTPGTRPMPGRMPGPSRRDVKPDGVGVLSLLFCGAGLVLVIVAFTAVAWLNLENTGLGITIQYDFGEAGGDSTIHGFAAAYFSWFGWLLLGLTALACIGATVPSSARTGMTYVGLTLGAGGFLATLGAMAALSSELHVSFKDFMDYFGAGPWLAAIGFLVAGFGAAFGKETAT